MSIRRRTLSVVVLAALVAALVAAVGGAAPKPAEKPKKASTPSSFFGVVPQDTVSDSDLAAMGKNGVKVLRIGLSWPRVQPNQLALYDFSSFDATVKAAAKNGITVLPYLYGTPTWVAHDLDHSDCTSDCRIHAPRSTEALAAWQSFASAATDRYGPNGTFWNPIVPPLPGDEIPYKPIRTWQIWNEQNSKKFYQPKPDPKSYEKLLHAAATGIRSQDPKADIVLGGMFGLPGRGNAGNAIAAATFLRDLLKVKRAKKDFDGYALHPYSDGLSFVVKQVEASRKQLKKSGYPNAELWITETGAASGGKPSGLNLGSQKAQAKRVTDTYKLFEKHRREWNVKLVAWFAWQDSSASDAICYFCAKAGLVTESRQPKQALAAYKRATK